MTWTELKKTIIAEYDSRNLKSRVRYNAIERIEIFIEQIKKMNPPTQSNPIRKANPRWSFIKLANVSYIYCALI